ncbi:MCE family protein [Nocardioides antri]|uniref:MCE family protein n=1 Tax=Nocardioides antri TaxID=2607659 RepID=A0A5B1M3N0_9ACTN|nr:MCE family protein [Nocardioides antri]KAA1427815.1 MCE family protein [Nocardioides antri]
MRRRVVALSVVALLVTAGVVLVRSNGSDTRTISATFSRTTSLYEGAAVKVLGVKVGRVDEIQVDGTVVDVQMSVDEDVDLPEDVTALIVPPSIVGDRFVQLSPAYVGGPELADGAHLGLDRTDVPMELEDTYDGLNKISAALGPNGVDRTGAFARLISASALGLKGNGRLLNSTLTDLAGLMSTLSATSDDFNGLVENLGTTTHTLAGKDRTIRALIRTMADVGTHLDGQGAGLTVAIRKLRTALGLVGTFTRTNRREIEHTVERLGSLSGQLAEHQHELREELAIAPLGLNGLLRSYVPQNWELSEIGRVPPGARTGAVNSRSDLLDDLETTLGYSLSAVCQGMPAEQRVQLAAFCSTLTSLGGDLGAVVDEAMRSRGAGTVSSVPGATSLDEILGGQ